MSEPCSRVEVDKIAKTIEHIVKSDTTACDHKERALNTMADALSSLASAVNLGRASLRMTHNARASGAARLSPEAIGTITLFLDKFDDRLVASQVCRLWRAVALDMPNPWPEMSFQSLGHVITPNVKHFEVDRTHGHCHNDVEAVFSEVDSDLNSFSRLLDLSWKAPFLVDFQLTSHCSDRLWVFRSSTKTMRKRIIQPFETGRPITRNDLAEALPEPPFVDQLLKPRGVAPDVLDILHPLCISAHRIVSLKLTTACNNWLLALPCLPPLTALRTLVVTAHEQEGFLFLPDALASILRRAVSPQLRVAFPVLETLDVSDIHCVKESLPHSPLRISAGRAASLLGSLPLLRRLDLNSAVWPVIFPDGSEDEASTASDAEEDETDGSSAQDDKWPSRPSAALKALTTIVLHSAGEAPGQADVNSRSIASLMELLPVNPGSIIELTADGTVSACEVYLSVFKLGGFRPTSVSIRDSCEWGAAQCNWLHVEATDDVGNERTCATGSCRWTGRQLLGCINSQLMTSLRVDASAWNRLSDGFDAPAVVRLIISLTTKDVEAVSSKPSYSPRSLLLPSLRSLRFEVDSSVKAIGNLGKDSFGRSYRLQLSVQTLALYLHAVSPYDGKVEKVVISEGMELVSVDKKEPGTETLKKWAESVVLL